MYRFIKIFGLLKKSIVKIGEISVSKNRMCLLLSRVEIPPIDKMFKQFTFKLR